MSNPFDALKGLRDKLTATPKEPKEYTPLTDDEKANLQKLYGDGVKVEEYACGVVPVRRFDQERGHRRYYVRRDGAPAPELGTWTEMTQFNPDTRRALVVTPIVERPSTGHLRYTTDPELKRKMDPGSEWTATLIDEWGSKIQGEEGALHKVLDKYPWFKSKLPGVFLE